MFSMDQLRIDDGKALRTGIDAAEIRLRELRALLVEDATFNTLNDVRGGVRSLAHKLNKL